MKRITTHFLFLAITVFAGAQIPDFKWVKTQNSPSESRTANIDLDAQGNIYQAGYFLGTMDADLDTGHYNFTSHGNYDVYIAKYDKDGKLIWAKTIGSTQGELAGDVHVDGASLYVLGNFKGTVDFDPGVDSFKVTAAYTSQFILKLDTAGNFVWAKTFVSTAILSYFNIPADMATDASHNLYFLGQLSGTLDIDPGAAVNNQTSAGNNDIGVLKLDASGNFSWFKKIGSTEDELPQTITVDNAGNIIFSGSHHASFDADPSASTFMLNIVYASNAVFVEKMSSAGNFIWAGDIRGGTVSVKIVPDASNDLVIAGYGVTTIDFDPGPDSVTYSLFGTNAFMVKWSAAGSYMWHKVLVTQTGQAYSSISEVTSDAAGNIFLLGDYETSVDFDPGADTAILRGGNIFFAKYDKQGNLKWNGEITDTAWAAAFNYIHGFVINKKGEIYAAGSHITWADFDISEDKHIVPASSSNAYDGYLLKLKEKQILCSVFNDLNSNCVRDTNETGVTGQILTVNPGNYVSLADRQGDFYFQDIPAGSYTAQLNIIGPWSTTCSQTFAFTVVNTDSTIYLPSFGLHTTIPCARPEVSVFSELLRPCFNNNRISITAANSAAATAVIDSAYVILTLDSTFTILSSTPVCTPLGSYQYKFPVGSLVPGQLKQMYAVYHLSCSVATGTTKCMKAEIFPVPSCAIDTSANILSDVAACTGAWDNSTVSVSGICTGDSVQFTITNTGANMSCYMPLRLFKDGNFIQLDSIKLNSGISVKRTYLGDSRTWRLESEQHPLHPGNSHPNASVEACGPSSTSANWTHGLIGAMPQDDEDADVDIFCGIASAAHDPNAKTGYPTGITGSHYIANNQNIDYVIQFQNTGTDTAFDVFIRDTLDMNLDITSIVSGAASDSYTFTIYGPRILQWSFRNILLPDSNTNEPESHGFIAFTVKQKPNLAQGTVLKNTAGIYFDYNAPVSTNTALHTIRHTVLTTDLRDPIADAENTVNIYPNPASGQLFIDTKGVPVMEISIYNTSGSLLQTSPGLPSTNVIDISRLSTGVYIAEIKTKEGMARKRWVKM